jgi:hypothetical protein
MGQSMRLRLSIAVWAVALFVYIPAAYVKFWIAEAGYEQPLFAVSGLVLGPALVTAQLVAIVRRLRPPRHG